MTSSVDPTRVDIDPVGPTFAVIRSLMHAAAGKRVLWLISPGMAPDDILDHYDAVIQSSVPAKCWVERVIRRSRSARIEFYGGGRIDLVSPDGGRGYEPDILIIDGDYDYDDTTVAALKDRATEVYAL